MDKFDNKINEITEGLMESQNDAILEAHFNEAITIDPKTIESKTPLTNGKGYFIVVNRTDVSGTGSQQDKYHMYVTDKNMKVTKDWGTHPRGDWAVSKFAKSRGLVEAVDNDAILESHFEYICEASKLEKISKGEFLNLVGNGVIFRGTTQSDIDSVIKKIDNSMEPSSKNYEKVDIKSNRMIRHGKSGKSELRFNSGDKFYKYGNNAISQSDDGISVYMLK
jgi:hypothetical protein